MASSGHILLLCLACVILPASVFSAAPAAPTLAATCNYAKGKHTCSQITCTPDGTNAGAAYGLMKGDKKLIVDTTATAIFKKWDENNGDKQAQSFNINAAPISKAEGEYKCLAFEKAEADSDSTESTNSITLGADGVVACDTSSAGRAVTSLLLLLPLLALPSLLL